MMNHHFANDLYDQMTKKNKKKHFARGFTTAKISTSQVLKELKESVVFKLPDKGQLFGERDTGKSVGEKYDFVFDSFRLPYPEVTLEFELSDRGRIKRLADSSPYDALVILLKEVDRGIAGFIFFRHTKKQVWDLCNYGFTILPNKSVEPIYATKGAMDLHHTRPESFFADVDGEITTVFEFLAVLHCTNVKEREQPASEKENKKRKESGKHPLFEYKTLAIPGTNAAGVSLGGTHAAPRTHLRRGHIRHLANGNRTWVNACVVNRERWKKGAIGKDYIVQP